MDIFQSHRKIQGAGERARGHDETLIDMFPDDILLEIFDAYRIYWCFPDVWRWDRLVHVCRRWRHIIFSSPLRLRLYLHCTYGTDVKKFLPCWPAFPISVAYTRRRHYTPSPADEDNVLAALEHSDRVGLLYLHMTESELEKLATVIQKPFPVLTKLRLSWKGWPDPVLPSEFLGGYVPCLQEFKLQSIPFPALPTLLLSACDLATLHLTEIPPAGYISPEAMVASLAPLTKLTSLSIGLQISTASFDQLDPEPVARTRIVLPSLTSLEFSCVCRYVEDLVARIDCPRLKGIDLYLKYSFVDLQLSQVFEFINRSEDPQLTRFSWVDVSLSASFITFKFYQEHPPHIPIFISLAGLFMGSPWENSHISQVLNQFSTMFSNVRHLSIDSSSECRDIPFTNLDWVQILASFSTLQTLDISGDDVGHIALALDDKGGEMAAKLLPALKLLYIVGEPESSVARFCAVSRLSGPVTLVKTWEEFDERLKSYYA